VTTRPFQCTVGDRDTQFLGQGRKGGQLSVHRHGGVGWVDVSRQGREAGEQLHVLQGDEREGGRPPRKALAEHRRVGVGGPLPPVSLVEGCGWPPPAGRYVGDTFPATARPYSTDGAWPQLLACRAQLRHEVAHNAVAACRFARHHWVVDTDARAVRAAQLDDAAAIGLVHVRSWQAAYAGHFPQEFLDALDPAARAEGWRRILGAQQRDRQTDLVAGFDGQVGGFASVGPSREDDAGGVGEVYAIYVLPELWGRGLGRQLMAAALDALAELGFDAATLWVLEDNHRARRFYETGGWSTDGATKVDDGLGFPIAEVRYHRPLA
jgi:ribosomal protein S18 acetylase RimI-like enzyme